MQGGSRAVRGVLSYESHGLHAAVVRCCDPPRVVLKHNALGGRPVKLSRTPQHSTTTSQGAS